MLSSKDREYLKARRETTVRAIAEIKDYLEAYCDDSNLEQEGSLEIMHKELSDIDKKLSKG